MHGTYEGLDRAGGFDRSGMLSPLKGRDFRLLWMGMSISLLGDGIFLIAVTWQAYELSSLPTALSLVGVAMTVPHVVFLLFGGVISDRFPRRKVMLGADVVRGVAIGAIAVLSMMGALELVHLAALAALYGAGTAFFGPAFDAIVPDVVPERLLPQANALDQLVKPLTLRLAGPALGGLIVGAWGPGAAFGVDAATFAFSAMALLMMSSVERPAGTGRSFVAELRSGYAFVLGEVWLWGTFVAAAVAYLLFMGPAEVLLPFILKEDMGGSAADLGLVFAVGGVGSILSAIAVSSSQFPRRNITFMYGAWTLSTLAIGGYGLANLPWHLMAASFAFNFLETAGTIVWITTKQRLVPIALLGRVSSIDWLISIGLLPLSFALTGPAAAAFGARSTLMGAGVLGAGVTMAAFFLPGMRAMERPPADEPPGRAGPDRREDLSVRPLYKSSPEPAAAVPPL